MKVLVIGGSGLLGGHLAVSLRQRGVHSLSLSRREALGYQIWVPFAQVGDLASILQTEDIGFVVNTAALASHEKCERDPAAALTVNALWAQEWAAACQASSVAFIHISTDAVFSGEASRPYRESDPIGPTSVYGRTKLEGEQRVLDANPDTLVIRTNFFGWSRNGKTGILDFFVNNLRAGLSVTGFTDYATSSIYAGHLADIVWTLSEAGKSGIVHVGSATPMSKHEFGMELADVFGMPGYLIQPGSKESLAHLVSRGSFLALDNTMAEVALARPMPTTREGLVLARQERNLCMSYFQRHPKERLSDENW